MKANISISSVAMRLISLLICLSVCQPKLSAAGASELLSQTKSALEDRLFALAADNMRALLKGDAEPREKAEAALLLAAALRGMEQYEEMLEVLSAFKVLLSAEPWIEKRDAQTAIALLGAGHWEAALEAAGSFELNHPESSFIPEIIRLKALAFMKLKKPDEALESFSKLAEHYGAPPEKASSLMELGAALADVGRSVEAAETLQQALDFGLSSKDEFECRIALGGIYLQLGDAEKAKAALAPAMKEQQVPDVMKIRAFDAMICVEQAQTNIDGALDLLDKELALLTDPALRAEVKLRRGRLLLQAGKIDEGIAGIREYVSSSGDAEEGRTAQLRLAETLLASEDTEKALIEYQNYLESFSDSAGMAGANEGKGWALFALGRFDEAAASFETASFLAADREARLLSMFKAADSFLAGGSYKKAMETYDAIIGLCPETPLADRAFFLLAEAKAGLGELSEAEAQLWELVDKDKYGPLAGEAILRIAGLKERSENPADALSVYELLLKAPDNTLRARAQVGAAGAFFRAGQYEEALLFFEEAAKAFPGGAEKVYPNYMSGWCLYMLGENEGARLRFKDVAERAPDETWAPRAAFWLAEHEYNRGAYFEAESGFIEFVKTFASSDLADSALFWAGRAAMAQKEYRRANDHFARLIKEYHASSKQSEARYYQGESLCEEGEFAGAILIFDEIIKALPGSEIAEMAWIRKGDSHFTLGSEDPARYEEAIASYKTILESANIGEQTKRQAEYKIARCFEKQGRVQEAFEHYMKVVYGYIGSRAKDPQSNIWFTRAAFNAAEIKERERSWANAVSIYQRVIDAAIPASKDAQERIKKIRTDHWMAFY